MSEAEQDVELDGRPRRCECSGCGRILYASVERSPSTHLPMATCPDCGRVDVELVDTADLHGRAREFAMRVNWRDCPAVVETEAGADGSPLVQSPADGSMVVLWSDSFNHGKSGRPRVAEIADDYGLRLYAFKHDPEHTSPPSGDAPRTAVWLVFDVHDARDQDAGGEA